MSYKIIHIMDGKKCPLCGRGVYLEESDELGDVRYAVWCSSGDCPRSQISRYSRVKHRAVDAFFKPVGTGDSVGTTSES